MSDKDDNILNEDEDVDDVNDEELDVDEDTSSDEDEQKEGVETRHERHRQDDRRQDDHRQDDWRQRRSPGGRSYSQSGPRRGGPGAFRRRRSVCQFCVDKVKYIDYKDLGTLREYIDDYGKIKPGRKTGTCARHQRRVALAVKRARHLALLPFTSTRFHRGE